jgi:hypothetical protein
VPGQGTRRHRLVRVARELEQAPEVLPYYLHRPGSRSEPAAGWYMIPAGQEFPIYLGYSAVDAEITLLEMRKLERTPA